MKKKTNISILPLLLISLFLVFAYGCFSDADEPSPDDSEEPSPDNEFNENSTANFKADETNGTITDQDGNVYRTVTIGTQTWMAENLRTTKYNDGTAIPNVTENQEWGSLTEGAYCNYDNTTDTDFIVTYGRLYNWHAINTGKLAPEGWHIPTSREWTTLTSYLDESLAVFKLKESGTRNWPGPNLGATNESGFTALPGGHRNSAGNFIGKGAIGYWWTATRSLSDASSKQIQSSSFVVAGWFLPWEVGFSVRCIMD
jgi:uncharacterized protein (TIGR02145 family)